MSDFVIRLPLGPAADRPARDPARSARLLDRGWTPLSPAASGSPPETVASDLWAAGTGAAGIARAGPLTMIGLASLNNRAELQEQLGVRAPDLSDLDLLARLCQRDGSEFPDQVSGAFSLLVLDRDTGQGRAYRDHFGILPFLYTLHGDHLTCGTDMRAVLHLSGLPLVQDRTRIADYIMGHEVDRDRTGCVGLSRLPAAHALHWSLDRSLDRDAGTPPVVPRRYWQLRLPEPIGAEAAIAGFRTHLQAATDACLDRAEGVGAMLSGGLDSSSLAGLAARTLETRGAPPLATLSFTYGADKPYDETGYIDAANTAFRTTPHLIPITAPPRLDEIPEIIEEQMELFLGYGLQKSRAIYPIARDLGLTDLIDGHGGDEVVSHGYGRLAELAAARRWVRLFIELRGATRVHGTSFWDTYLTAIAQHGGLPQGHPVRRMLMRIARRLAPDGGGPEMPVTPRDLLAPALRAELDMARYDPPPPPRSRADRLQAESHAHLAKLDTALMERAFEVLHRAASAAGITPRYPFFERHLVRFCLSMPSEVKLQGGATRWVLRKAMTGVLPERIRTRSTKAEFTPEFQEAIQIYIAAGGAPCSEGTDAFVDPKAAQALDGHVRAVPDGDSAACRLWWRVLVLRDWLQAFERWQKQQISGELL